ncbi:hypothetical protein POM88_026487 [Heracleum sosnowskyi]|uniref:RNA polymerase II C-terminal domain phosphatase-like n=1 Tax=Heracleum sosnowskyi TaxID=360622 RepID=A0AAD8MNY6_9APIA|nr:hypothetical protein POM88_026486 [Heracleum sosnowskyi]KAK1379743.1 hypothetical protein POM88_026487 [Heracleum sosnowskyi]
MGEEIRVTKSISFDYLVEGLEMSCDEVERVRDIQLRNLQSRRKLCLVLDLDHTLLHTDDFRQNPNIDVLGHDDMFEWKGMGMEKVYITKLRPFVRNFLEEASEMFELYVYTMGSRNYAHIVTDFLDPEGLYFGNRIISREDCTTPGQKGLDVVPVEPSAVVILDDTESVWKGYFANLILVEKYDYFSNVGLDESEEEGELSCALEVLTKLHSVYFEWYDSFIDCDVRELIHTHWEEIQGQQGLGTCSSHMESGKRARVDDECLTVTKKQRDIQLSFFISPGGSWYSEYFGSSFRTEAYSFWFRASETTSKEAYEVASNVSADSFTPIAGNVFLPTGESLPCLKWNVSSNIEDNFLFNTDGLNYEEMEFEPHTYFSFNELLPDDDGAQLDRVDPSENFVENMDISYVSSRR